PDVLELASRVEETDWGWVLCAGPGRVTGRDAAVLLADGVDVLEALDRVRVTVRDGVPEIRRATEGPRIGVAAEEDRSGIDWLGLSVSVTVEGRPVPFGSVFSAVVSGEEEFVTDDGVLVPVDLERFGELRTLLEEALASSADRAGRDPGSGDIRIGLGQAGAVARRAAGGTAAVPAAGAELAGHAVAPPDRWDPGRRHGVGQDHPGVGPDRARARERRRRGRGAGTVPRGGALVGRAQLGGGGAPV